MTTRAELLHSSIRLLYQDQKRVTDAFADWTATEDVQRHESVRSVMASVLRHLQRDLDRLYVLVQSYSSAVAPARGVSAAGAEEYGGTNGTAELPPSLGEEVGAPAPSLDEILPRGYQALDELSTRYASVYCVATALTEPPLANVARANLEGLRSRLSELIGMWPLVMVHTVATKHPTFRVNRSAGPRIQALLRSLWGPTMPGADAEQERR